MLPAPPHAALYSSEGCARNSDRLRESNTEEDPAATALNECRTLSPCVGLSRIASGYSVPSAFAKEFKPVYIF